MGSKESTDSVIADQHKNFSYSTVLTAPSPATSGTSLVLASGGGALMPTVPFNATIWPTGASPLSSNAEIVRVTAIATDTLTITRTQESSSARTVVVGDQFAATITVKTLTDIETLFASYLALAGGTVTGQTTFNASGSGSTGAVTTNVVTVKPNSGIGGSASMFLDNTVGQVWEFYCSSGGTFGIWNKTGSYSLSSYASNALAEAINVYSTGVSIGKSGNSGNILEVGGNTAPGTNNSFSLGTASLYWASLYAARHYLNSTAYIDGATAGELGIFGKLVASAGTTSKASLTIPAGVAPTTPVAGDVWYDGTTLLAYLNAATRQIIDASSVQTLTNKTLTSPIMTSPALGAATGTSLATTGLITSSGTAGVGYATGAGGTVTQATSKSTGVTLSKTCGAITMNAAALASGAIVSFVMTNTTVAATDVLILNHISGGTIGPYLLNAQCGAGSVTINVRNTSAGSLSEAIVIQFVLVKGVTS